jgi:hypothetical protein
MEGLGRLFNVVQPATGVYVSLKDATGVTFEGLEVDGATAVTITFSTDAAGTSTATPDIVDHWYERSSDQNSGKWVAKTQAASETFHPTDGTGDHWAVYVPADACPAGMPYVKATADGGTVTAILHDLAVQRKPSNLRSVTA